MNIFERIDNFIQNNNVLETVVTKVVSAVLPQKKVHAAACVSYLYHGSCPVWTTTGDIRCAFLCPGQCRVDITVKEYDQYSNGRKYTSSSFIAGPKCINTATCGSATICT